MNDFPVAVDELSFSLLFALLPVPIVEFSAFLVVVEVDIALVVVEVVVIVIDTFLTVIDVVPVPIPSVVADAAEALVAVAVFDDVAVADFEKVVFVKLVIFIAWVTSKFH